MKTLQIPNNLNLNNLKILYPPPTKGYKDVKVYFVCDSIYAGSYKLDENTLTHPDKTKPYFVPLHTALLSHYLGRDYYKSIINWMIQAGIIQTDHSYIKELTSLGYKFTDEYRNCMFQRVVVDDYAFSAKKPFIFSEPDSELPINTTKRLKRWYEKLSIDTVSSREIIDVIFEKEISEISNNDKEKRDNAIQKRIRNHTLLNNFNTEKRLAHFRDQNGWRLYNCITSLPKVLRRFVRYDGMELAQTDLSNSQLYFTTYLLKEGTWETSNKVLSAITKQLPFSFGSTNMFTDSFKTLYRKGLYDEKFVSLVSTGTMYDYLVVKLDGIPGLFKPEMDYKEKRNMVKLLLLQQIYADSSAGKPKGFSFSPSVIKRYRMPKKLREAKDIKNQGVYKGIKGQVWETFSVEFPTVAALYNEIKYYDYTALSKLLTRIESTAVLDIACNHIYKEYPTLPIFTLHDCLVSTVDIIDGIDFLFTEAIGNFIGVMPKTETKLWQDYDSGDLQYRNAA